MIKAILKRNVFSYEISTHPFTYSPKKGLTLIELAIILVVIGLLVALGAALVGVLTKRAKIIDTKEILNANVEAIISWAAGNKRLPNITEFTSVVRNPNDAWTKPFYYVVDDDLVQPAGAEHRICGRRTTKITVRVYQDATNYQDIPNVAFIMLSGGGNYNNQTAGTQSITSATTIQVQYPDAPNIDYYPDDLNRPEPYDDIVKWITLDELRIKVGCVGSQMKIINNELASGIQCTPYNAIISAEGGVPFITGGKYKWCRQENASTGLTFNPSTLDTNCINLSETSWGQSDNLVISGNPTNCGTFQLTFFARDNNDPTQQGVIPTDQDNYAQKQLSLTINPATSGCTGGYRVWNDTGRQYDFKVDGRCVRINNGAEITDQGAGLLLNPCEVIERYATNNGRCGGGVQAILNYCQAMTADDNGDCCVKFTGTDRTCP